jgi:cyclophilin family peptidyl-prolyl cis-trans isomerase
MRAQSFPACVLFAAFAAALPLAAQVTPPASPTNGGASLAARDAVSMTWRDNSNNENGFVVYRYANGAVVQPELGRLGRNATRAVLSGAEAGAVYQFAIYSFRLDPGTNPNNPATVLSSAFAVTPPVRTGEWLRRTGWQATAGTAFSRALEPTNPSRVASSTLTGPAWLSYDPTTRLCTGVPPAPGVYKLTATVRYQEGWVTRETLTLRVLPPLAGPQMTSPPALPALANARGPRSVDLTRHFRDPDAQPAVKVTTNLGSFDVILHPVIAPAAVNNFLTYVRAAPGKGYDGTIFHRSVSGFVLQGGGYTPTGGIGFNSVPRRPPVVNEPGLDNVFGTVAMAKLGGDPNSATCEWFVNLGDNRANLDYQNGGFTVFGRVAAPGMQVVQTIAALPRGNYQIITVDGQLRTNLLDSCPVNAAVAPAGMDQDLLVKTLSVRETGPLVYSILTPPAPAVASAAVANGVLTVTPVAEGTTTVRVRVADLDGTPFDQDLAVTVVGDGDGDGVPDDEDVFAGTVPPAEVSQLLDLPLVLPPGATGFEVTRLPPGMKFDRARNALVGRPTRGGTFAIRVRARYGRSAGAWQEIVLQVAALPPSATGSFTAWIGREATLNGGYGGILTLTTTSGGGFSASLRLGATSLSARGVLETGPGSDPRVAISIPRRGLTPLELALELKDDNSLGGTIADGPAVAQIRGWRQTWNTRSNPPPAPRRGAFTLLLYPENFDASAPTDRSRPQGIGYGTLTTSTAGLARFACKLPDGTPVAYAAPLGPDGELVLWALFPRGAGSVLGELALADDGEITGQPGWWRVPAAGRVYPGGIGSAVDPLLLDAFGAPYQRPASGQFLTAWQLGGHAPNTSLQFFQAGLDERADSPDTTATVTAAGRITLPAAGSPANPARATFTANLTTGTVRGSIRFTDPNPAQPGRTLTRIAPFEGVLMPSAAGNGVLAAGYMLLAAEPDPAANPPTTPATAPLFSGPFFFAPLAAP